MISFDYYTNENKTEKKFKVAIYSRSSIQSINDRWFWILDQEKQMHY